MCSFRMHVHGIESKEGSEGATLRRLPKVAAKLIKYSLLGDRSRIHTSEPYCTAPIATYITMLRNLRPLLSKGASTSRRTLASTPVRALATPAIEGRSSPVRSHSVEE
jgi:hypothetical protein